jgi:hypothetical protein
MSPQSDRLDIDEAAIRREPMMTGLCGQMRAVMDAPEFVTLATLGRDGRARALAN